MTVHLFSERFQHRSDGQRARWEEVRHALNRSQRPTDVCRRCGETELEWDSSCPKCKRLNTARRKEWKG